MLASPATATDTDFLDIESVVGHEYFHNWTGNRITCRDWFQLSLKEGLTVFRDQEFSMDMVASPTARAIKRIHDVRFLRETQFTEDAGPMAHPVRPEAYTAIDNFYTTTVYEKGAEVVRMMHTLVGREGFRRGMDLYFQRHDGQAVTCDDFAQAIADANPGSWLAEHLEAFKRWYSQAGTPILLAHGHYDAMSRSYTLRLGQRCLPTPDQSSKQPFVIPVALSLLARDGQPLKLRLQGEPMAGGTERVLVLSDVSHTFTFVDIDAEPVPSLLRGFSAPVQLDDAMSDADLRVLLQHDTDAFNRWEAGQRLLMQTMVAALHAGSALQLDSDNVAALRTVLRDPIARRRAERAAADAAGREQRGRARHAGRSAAHPRTARAAARPAGRTPARRLAVGPRVASGARGLPGRHGSGRPPRAVQSRARHAGAARRAQRRHRVARQGPAALQRRDQHDRPRGRA